MQAYIYTKTQDYTKIDLDRMPRFYEKYKKHFSNKKIIHVIGTNGKGSTSRWIALMLMQAGFSVGHFTSPHIFDVSERFWKNGDILNEKMLQFCHENLKNIMGEDNLDELSFFEYCTFLAYRAFEDCDFMIFEAGLGGEYDSTNVFEKCLSVITCIDFDHTHILGNTLNQIAMTKINAICHEAIISFENKPDIFKIAKNIADNKNANLKIASEKYKNEIEAFLKKHQYANFLYPNLSLAINAVEHLGVKVDLQNLPKLDLKGRFERFKENVIIDVGHNPHSAKAVLDNISFDKIILIYNAYEDKDIKGVLDIFYPKIKKVMIMPIDTNHRKSAENIIKNVCKQINIACEEFDFKLDCCENYLVYGSFLVVEKFLRSFNAQ